MYTIFLEMMSQPLHRLCLGVAACVISSVAFEASPVQAATFSFSGSRLTLNNFSALPQVKDSTLVTDAIAKTGQGSVNNNFDGSLDFFADTQTRLDGLFEVQSQGDGARYFGTSQITSNAFAQFLVAPQQTFSFDFQVATLLSNQVESAFERATALTNFSISLLAPDQTVLKFFTLEASVNTNSLDESSNDVLNVDTNGQVLNSDSQFSPSATQETGLVSFAGRFDQTVSQPTLLTLSVSTRNQSCVQTPSVADACVRVPEGSLLWAFGLTAGLGLLILPRRLQSPA